MFGGEGPHVAVRSGESEKTVSVPITKQQYCLRTDSTACSDSDRTDIPNSVAGGTNEDGYRMSTGLTYGTQHFFWVPAVNMMAMGGVSNQASVTPLRVPYAPTNLQADAGKTSVRLTWTAGADGGSAITKR